MSTPSLPSNLSYTSSSLSSSMGDIVLHNSAGFKRLEDISNDFMCECTSYLDEQSMARLMGTARIFRRLFSGLLPLPIQLQLKSVKRIKLLKIDSESEHDSIMLDSSSLPELRKIMKSLHPSLEYDPLQIFKKICFQNVQDIHAYSFNDKLLEQISSFINVRELDLKSYKITPISSELIQKLFPHLRTLKLDYYPEHPTGVLLSFLTLPIKTLSISEWKIRIEDLSALQLQNHKNISLTDLNLSFTNITGEHLRIITGLFPNLEELNLLYCGNIVGADFVHVRRLPSLRILHSQCELKDIDVDHLPPSLKNLYIAHPFQSETSLKHLEAQGCVVNGAIW